MVRRACAVAAAALGVAACPAAAGAQDASQQVKGSAGVVQVGSAEIAPAVAATAPVTANAPVTVASPNSGGDATTSGGSAATASSGRPATTASPGRPATTASSGGRQDTTGSVATAQIGAADASPSAAVDAPATVNVPVTVASPNSGGDATSSGGSGATASTTGSRPSSRGGPAAPDRQTTSKSAGSAQVGSLRVSPAVAAAAPATVNAPVTVLSANSGGDACQPDGSSASAVAGGPASGGTQDTSGSVGAAQIGSAGISPSVTVTAPATANAPVTIASPESGGDATMPGGSATTASSGGGEDATTTAPGADGTPQGSAPPPGDDGTTGSAPPPDDDGTSAGGGADGPADPATGTQGEYADADPGGGALIERAVLREMGAPAGLPFTGLLVWAVALTGLLALAGGTTGRWAAVR